jgi:hypothetical protein
MKRKSPQAAWFWVHDGRLADAGAKIRQSRT